MDADSVQAIQEAMRRRSGLGASGAGISGGIPASNALVGANPIASGGMSTNQPQPQPSMLPQNPSENPMKMMNEAKTGEAEMIVKGLLKRLDQLGQV